MTAQKYINLLGSTVAFPKNDLVLKFLREGWYEFTEQIFLVNFLKPGDTFIDAGAHAGMYSVLAQNQVGDKGRVIAIEPNSDILPYLETNLGVKSIHIKNLSKSEGKTAIVKCAIGSSNGKTTLFRGKVEKSAYASIYYSDNESQAVDVDMATLDSLWSKLKPKTISLMKLDIEGGELKALSKASKLLAANPDIAILMELSLQNQKEAGETLDDFKALISKLGLSITMFDAEKGKLIRATFSDDIWYTNYVLVKNIKKANQRLSKKLDAKTEAATRDFLEKSRSSHQLYEQAESVAKIGDVLQASIEPLANIKFNIGGDDKERIRILKRFSKFGNMSTPEEIFGVIAAFQDELGQVRSGSASLSDEIARERSLLHEFEAEKTKLKDRLLQAKAQAEDSKNSAAQVEESKDEIDRLNTRIEALNAQARESENNKIALEKALMTSETQEHQISTMREHLRGLNAELVEAKSEGFKSDLLSDEITALKKEIDSQKKHWAMRNDLAISRDQSYEKLLSELEEALKKLVETEGELNTVKRSQIKSQAKIDRTTEDNKQLFEDIQELTEKLDQLAQASEVSSTAHMEEVEELSTALAATQRLHEEQNHIIAALRNERSALIEKIDIFREARDEMVAEIHHDHAIAITKSQAKIEELSHSLQTHEAKQNDTHEFLSATNVTLAKSLETMEQSRLKMQSLIATTEATKNSRWIKFGKMIGVGPKDTLTEMSELEQSMKTMLTNVAASLRATTEEQFNVEMQLKNSDTSIQIGSANNEHDNEFNIHLEKDVAKIGDHAYALQRSRLMRIARFLNLKSAKELDDIVDVFTGNNRN